MNHTMGRLRAIDGVELFWQSWTPEETPHARLLIVHGLGEHSGRYGAYVDYFVPRGYAFYGFDRRGHGRSGGARGDAASYDYLLDEVGSALVKVQNEQPATPIFLLGHSMGGNVALNYVLRRPAGLSGAIITSPWLRLPKDPPGALVASAKVLSRVLPTVAIGNGLDVKGISRDQAAVATYRADPLNHDRITPRMFLACQAAATWALDHAGELKIPVLLTHGSDDRLTSLAGTHEFWNRAPKDLVQFRQFDGSYHEVHNDIDKEALFKQVEEWLEQRVGAFN